MLLSHYFFLVFWSTFQVSNLYSNRTFSCRHKNILISWHNRMTVYSLSKWNHIKLKQYFLVCNDENRCNHSTKILPARPYWQFIEIYRFIAINFEFLSFIAIKKLCNKNSRSTRNTNGPLPSYS